MANSMLRKSVAAGAATEFKFGVRSCVFLVKNMTEGNVFVSFGENPGSTDKMILIPPGTWQRHVCLLDSGELASCDTVFVVGSGDPGDGVEVECLRW